MWFTGSQGHSIRRASASAVPWSLGGQVELILFGVDVGVFGQGEFGDGPFGGFAEEEADGGVFLREFYFAVVVWVVLQAKELKHERLLQQVLGTEDDLAFLGEPPDAFLVPAEGKALVEAGGFLAFEFADIPVCLTGFNLVEAPLVWVLDGHEHDVVRPTEGEGRFARHCLAN